MIPGAPHHFQARQPAAGPTELYDFTLGSIPSGLSSVGITSSGPATVINSSGQHAPATLISGSTYQPRFMYHPTTLQCLGWITEQASTNLLAGHSCASPQLTTQSRSVTNIGHTLSFNGTGSITLSGVATGTITGTGANVRRIHRFTPTAGTLTLTVSGTVTHANLEFGDVATTYIENTGSVGTNASRPDDPNIDVSGTPFTDLWDGSSSRTLFFEWYDIGLHPQSRDVAFMRPVSGSGMLGIYYPGAPAHLGAINSSGGFVGVVQIGGDLLGTYMQPQLHRAVMTINGGLARASANGGAVAALPSTTYPTFGRIRLGGATLFSGGRQNLIWSKIGFRTGVISDSAMQALSAI